MKKKEVLPFIFFIAFVTGCSSANFSPTQTFTQKKCPASTSCNNESKEKQCCLKDSLNIIINQNEKICKSDEKNDRMSKVDSSTTNISPSIKYLPRKSLKVNGKIENQSREVNNTGIGCFGQNCEINNIYFESKSEIEGKDCQEKEQLSKSEINDFAKGVYYYYSILLSIVFALFFLKHYTPIIIEKFKRYKRNKSAGNSEKRDPYEILSPCIKKDTLSEQTKKQLEFAIFSKQKEIKNIAITGPYGAGKSSIWASFCDEKEISENDQIQISFANFKSNSTSKKDPSVVEAELERVIIQQLIYSKENKDLKHSNFKKIENPACYIIDIKAFLYLFLFSATASVIIKVFFPEILETSILYLKYFFTNYYKTAVCSAIIAVLVLYHAATLIINKVHKIKVSKLCINNIELSFDKDNSLFDKYLNEIVYFFEATKSKLVVIEDLDRFDASLKIFTKLREINTLLNNYPAIKKTGIIKFVYMIKDDIFSKYERTKFFDYIVPVIPTLSVNNSASIFKHELDLINTNLSEDNQIDLNELYLIDIQDYLKDFRLLKNCINEFLIYRDEIKKIGYGSFDNKVKAIIEGQDLAYVGELFNKKLFSLILYKNLFPKDFSYLEKNEGVLFDCLNKIDENLNIAKDKRPNKSIKEILTINNSPKSRAKFEIIIQKLNEEYNYNDKECVVPDLLLTLLICGYIENDYEMYIKKYDDSILNKNEQMFLLNVKNDIPASGYIELRNDKLGIICKSIKSYQWNSPGILNNTIIDYILTEKEPDSDKKATQIIEAMLDFDGKNIPPNRFIPRYFEHYDRLNENLDLFLETITSVFLDKNSRSDNNPEIEGVSGFHESIIFLEYFFKDVNVKYFINFLHYIDEYGAVSYNTSDAISEFLDFADESFKERLFTENDDYDTLISLLENNGITIILTPQICKELRKYGKISSKIYWVNQTNIDLILNEFGLSTEEKFYLTRCLNAGNLKERILDKTFETFNNVLYKFTNVDEEYFALKTFFDSNSKSNKKIPLEKIIEYINKLPLKWEKFVIYSKYASFDDKLSESIKVFLNSNNSSQEISDSLKNDKSDIKEFVRAVIKKSNITNDILHQYFLLFWEKYVSILSCYDDNRKQEIQEMDFERNHLLQNYIIDKVKNKTNGLTNDFSDIIKESINTIVNLIIKDLDYFERTYFVSNFSEETELEKVILETDVENADSIKGLFIKNFSPNSKIEENKQRFKLYKNAGLQIKISSSSAIVFLNTLKNQLNGVINNIKVIDLLKFSRVDINVIMDRFKKICDTIVFTNDSWSILLYQNFTFWANKFVIFMEDNTIDIGYPNWGLKEPDRNDEKIVKERKNAYQEIVQKLEFWAKELDEYRKVFA